MREFVPWEAIVARANLPVARALFTLSKFTHTSLASMPVTTVSWTLPVAVAGVSVILAIAIGPKLAGAGGMVTVGSVVVTTGVVVEDTVMGTEKLAALIWSFAELAKIDTVVVPTGETVTDQSLPLTLVPCTLLLFTIAKTNWVWGVVRTENVTDCPEAIVVRSMLTFVKAGLALAVSGIAAMNRTATATVSNALMNVFFTFETKNIISF